MNCDTMGENRNKNSVPLVLHFHREEGQEAGHKDIQKQQIIDRNTCVQYSTAEPGKPVPAGWEWAWQCNISGVCNEEYI